MASMQPDQLYGRLWIWAAAARTTFQCSSQSVGMFHSATFEPRMPCTNEKLPCRRMSYCSFLQH